MIGSSKMYEKDMNRARRMTGRAALIKIPDRRSWAQRRSITGRNSRTAVSWGRYSIARGAVGRRSMRAMAREAESKPMGRYEARLVGSKETVADLE